MLHEKKTMPLFNIDETKLTFNLTQSSKEVRTLDPKIIVEVCNQDPVKDFFGPLYMQFKQNPNKVFSVRILAWDMLNTYINLDNLENTMWGWGLNSKTRKIEQQLKDKEDENYRTTELTPTMEKIKSKINELNSIQNIFSLEWWAISLTETWKLYFSNSWKLRMILVRSKLK